MNSKNTTNDYVVSDQLRDLIVRYMEACNKGDNVSADALLDAIKAQGIKDQQ
jgi:hypothetical protein